MKIHEVILQAKAGELKWYQAADILGITDRHLRRLRARFEANKDGLFRRTFPSPKKLNSDIAQKIVMLYQEEYQGYNIAHFHEELQELHHIKVGYTCVKKLLQENNLVLKHKQRGKYRRRRERKPMTGMMLHIDGSPHRWFEHENSELQCLIAIIDDADSKCLAAKFFPQEGTLEVMEVVKNVVAQYGTFVSFYTDRASHFAHTPQAGGPIDPKAKTQLEVVLDELGIELIRAYSPQARGRGERAWRTMQGRLPAELKKANITTYEDANAYLEKVFCPKYNTRFSVAPTESGTAFLKVSGVNLDRIFCRRHERKINKDYTISLNNRILQLPKPKSALSLGQRKVVIREHLDGSLEVFTGKRLIASFPNLHPFETIVNLDQPDTAHAAYSGHS